MKIYFAGPLHSDSDKQNNVTIVELLRHNGHHVYLPQEHGVVIDVKSNNHEQDVDVLAQRKFFYEQDIRAMRQADICIACVDRVEGPSEGMLYEIGWFAGANKTVYLYNPRGYWHYGVMVRYGTRYFEDITLLLRELEEEEFK